MDLKGSQTEINLQTAFAGESQAHTKYEYYASQAKDGYEQIAALFLETSHNEKEHAKIWFKYLHGGEMPETLPNLEDAAAGENYEWTDMYAGLPRPPARRASRRSPCASRWSVPSRSSMRSAIVR